MEGYSPGAIWAAVDHADAQCREVFSRFGLAMYTAHLLEHGMVNAIMVLRMLPTMRDYADRSAWEVAFDKAFGIELAKTFGNMVRGLETLASFPDDLLVRLRAAKMQRDHLAHRFFREHDMDFMTEAGRTRMIAECEELIELFQGLDKKVEAFAAPTRERYGVTKDWIERQVEEAEQAARERDG